MKKLDLKNLDLNQSESLNLRVETSSVWEVILGIAGFTHRQLRHTFDLDQEWENSFASMSKTLKDLLNEIEKTNLWYGLILLQERISAETIEDFSNDLSNMDNKTLYGTLLPYKDRFKEPIRKSLIDDLGEDRDFKDYASFFDDHEYLNEYVLVLDSYSREKLIKILVRVVKEWHEWVSQFDEWTKWNRALDFEGKQHQSINHSSPVEFIELVTGGTKYFPEPSIWTVKMVPQVSYRPWTLTVRTPDTKLFFYPLKEEYLLEPGTPSMELIRGHKALGDETRLKILYQLTKGSSSLQDLSIQFNISKPTIHHQLSLLKAVKFVRVDKGIYSIDKTQISSFSERLSKFLGETL